jgi:hypothetical protein
MDHKSNVGMKILNEIELHANNRIIIEWPSCRLATGNLGERRCLRGVLIGIERLLQRPLASMLCLARST